MDPQLQSALGQLSQDARDYHLPGRVPVLAGPPEALSFLRGWVGPNSPVLIRNAVAHWPAVKRWDSHYLTSQMGDQRFPVAVTPDGYADAVKSGLFVMPHEAEMTMSEFLAKLTPEEPHIHYIQRQNSNLTQEFAALQADVLELPWASQAFDAPPDAVNFWMGDERAITATHKDPYENIYCVVRGHKDIILHPPSDVPWLDYRSYRQAIHTPGPEGFTTQLVADSEPIPWVSVDPLDPTTQSPAYRAHANPITVRVEAGDALYLPSLWFHHVRQSHGCMAVNFWYDMKFDARFTYFKLLQNLAYPGLFAA